MQENTILSSVLYPGLNLPESELRLRLDENKAPKVFDNIRRKFVCMTPEEIVRQCFTSWLTGTLHYPLSLMANEIGIELNGTRKRCDTVVFRADGSPLMIVEYKAPDVSISQTVFDQIVRYNMALKALCLVVSNGVNHFCCLMDYSRSTYSFLKEVPDYYTMKSMEA